MTDYTELENLSDEDILGLYDDIIAWTKRVCDGYGYEAYNSRYYGNADRYTFYSGRMYAGYCIAAPRHMLCESYSDIGTSKCCIKKSERCSTGFELIYNSYFEADQGG